MEQASKFRGSPALQLPLRGDLNLFRRIRYSGGDRWGVLGFERSIRTLTGERSNVHPVIDASDLSFLWSPGIMGGGGGVGGPIFNPASYPQGDWSCMVSATYFLQARVHARQGGRLAQFHSPGPPVL